MQKIISNATWRIRMTFEIFFEFEEIIIKFDPINFKNYVTFKKTL
jgi:hypothetical protein